MRRKIVPTLMEWIGMSREELRQSDPGWRAANAELRALLAVARAARSVARIDGDGSNLEIPTEYWTPLQKMHGALSRLDRLSRPHLDVEGGEK